MSLAKSRRPNRPFGQGVMKAVVPTAVPGGIAEIIESHRRSLYEIDRLTEQRAPDDLFEIACREHRGVLRQVIEYRPSSLDEGRLRAAYLIELSEHHDITLNVQEVRDLLRSILV